MSITDSTLALADSTGRFNAFLQHIEAYVLTAKRHPYN